LAHKQTNKDAKTSHFTAKEQTTETNTGIHV